jgi:RND family efflux transporter MFP subunit
VSRIAIQLVASAALATIVAACQEPAAATRQAERPVLVTRVVYEQRTPDRTFVGTVRPRIESDLGFRVGGKVARRLVTTGDRVKAGQALATLDDTDLKLQREQAEAEIRAAAASLAQAEAELKRISTLRNAGWSTATGYDRQKALTEEARERRVRAERALALAQNALSYATLSADADGVVTATQIEPGQVVAAGQPAVRLARTGEKEAVVAVPEALVEHLRGGTATVTLWADGGRHYAASLRELSPSADPVTRTYLARYTIQKAGDDIQLGMTATVSLRAAGTDRIARLPLSALYNQGQGPAVWVVGEGGTLALKPVTVATLEARQVLISAGIEEGDEVVALGVQKLDAGQRVRVVQALQF